MKKQRTIKQELTFSGVGLHKGNEVNLSLHPAEENSGIKFQRTDIADSAPFKADVNYVDSTNRGTFLKNREIEIATVEHLLAALSGAGIDNVLIKMDGNEVPILDGSAIDFSNALSEVGVEEFESKRDTLVIEKVMEFTDEASGASYTLLPADKFEAVVMVDYDSNVLRKQYAEWNEDESFKQELASARTFVFAKDLLGLLNQGLIKGGDVSNAIIYSDEELSSESIAELSAATGKTDLSLNAQGILNNAELRFPNEAARHKLLDLIGDLKLIGASIKGKIIANKPGHTGNVALAKVLKKEFQKQKKLRNRPIYDPTIPPTHTLEDIKAMLPHRYPFLMVDKIIELTETSVVGIKNVTFNENFFMGHFPGNPVFPGVLQMEALAQAGGILALSTVEEPEKYDTYFLKMDAVKFKNKVVPGDTMILKMELMAPIRRGLIQMRGTVYVGDSIVSEGELVAQIIKSR